MANLVNVDVGGMVGGLFQLIDKLFPNETDRAAARLKVLEMEQRGELAQIAVNAQEAQHGNVFVAGWRPFVGWVGGVSLALLAAISVAFAFGFISIVAYQAVTAAFMTTTLPILGGMLGLRTFDKYKGTETKVITAAPKSDGVDRRAK